MIVAKVPYRVSLLGGGTDYPSWYREYGGRFLGAAIEKYLYISLRYLPHFFEGHISRIVWSKIELVDDNNKIEHPVVRAALQAYNIREGVEVHYDGDLPARSGMGSSSAFVIGMLAAILKLKGVQPIDSFEARSELVSLAIGLERKFLQESGGIQDQLLTAMGGVNYVEIYPNETYDFFPVGLNLTGPLRYTRHRLLESHLGLFHIPLSIERYSPSLSRSWDRELSLNKEAFSELSEVVLEGYLSLERNLDIREFGKLLDIAWKIKRKISTVRSDKISDYYSRFKSLGAYGGKLLGAGGGGFFLVCAPPEVIKKIHTQTNLIHIPVQFDYNGVVVTNV